jgi:hypothetical protein
MSPGGQPSVVGDALGDPRPGFRTDFDDLHAWLIEECWILSLRFEPGPASFSSYAGARLRLRVIDWKRQQQGGRTVWRFKDRVHTRTPPVIVSLDDPVGASLDTNKGDPAPDWFADDGGLLAERDRCRDRDYAELGGKAPRARTG